MRKLHEIWSQVPADYFSQGTTTNILQRIWHNGKFRAVVNAFGRERVHRLVEVGSADGSFINRVSSVVSCHTIVAIDPYFPPLKFGKQHFPQVKYIQGDARHLPIKSGSVNVVTILETLEHVVDPYAVLIELKRIVRKDGSFIVEIDSGNILFQVVWFFWKQLGKGRVWKDAHLTLFTMQTLERLFVEAGFRIKQKNVFNWGMGVCYKLRK